MKILVINAGSSSCKYQLLEMDTHAVLCSGLADRSGRYIRRDTRRNNSVSLCKLFSCDTLRRELVYGRFVNIPYEPVKTRFALDFLPLHTVPESAIIIKV